MTKPANAAVVKHLLITLSTSNSCLDRKIITKKLLEYINDPTFVRVPVTLSIEMIAAIGFGGDVDLAIGHANFHAEIQGNHDAMIAASKGEGNG